MFGWLRKLFKNVFIEVDEDGNVCETPELEPIKEVVKEAKKVDWDAETKVKVKKAKDTFEVITDKAKKTKQTAKKMKEVKEKVNKAKKVVDKAKAKTTSKKKTK